MVGFPYRSTNSGIGVTTDSDGTFAINAPITKAGCNFLFRYGTQDLSLTNAADYTVRMTPAINA
jgi:hypothetical protein